MTSTALTVGPEIALSLPETMQIAKAFYDSGLFKDLKDQSQALVKILKGRELGLQPMASMSAFDIIQGELFTTAQACAALINMCPYAGFTPIKTTMETCIIRFHKRMHGAWCDLPDVEYTIDIATARGLVNRSPEWKTDPANMLYWRCMTRGARHYFPELLMGLMVREEQDMVSKNHADQVSQELYGEKPEFQAPLPVVTPLSDEDQSERKAILEHVMQDVNDVAGSLLPPAELGQLCQSVFGVLQWEEVALFSLPRLRDCVAKWEEAIRELKEKGVSEPLEGQEDMNGEKDDIPGPGQEELLVSDFEKPGADFRTTVFNRCAEFDMPFQAIERYFKKAFKKRMSALSPGEQADILAQFTTAEARDALTARATAEAHVRFSH